MAESARAALARTIFEEIRDKPESEQVTILESWLFTLSEATIMMLRDEMQKSLDGFFAEQLKQAQEAQ
jgi:hypothetical protein